MVGEVHSRGVLEGRRAVDADIGALGRCIDFDSSASGIIQSSLDLVSYFLIARP